MKHRAFSLIEMMIVGVIVAIAAAVGIGLTVRTTNTIDDSQVSAAAYEFIQRERNAHVNRAIPEALVICGQSSPATPCDAPGPTLAVYVVPYPVVMPPAIATQVAVVTYPTATISTSLAALFVDQFARATSAGGAPVAAATPTDVTLVLKAATSVISFFGSGATQAFFGAPVGIVAAPHVDDLGSRTTPNPTPSQQPTALSAAANRGRQVALE